MGRILDYECPTHIVSVLPWITFISLRARSDTLPRYTCVLVAALVEWIESEEQPEKRLSTSPPACGASAGADTASEERLHRQGPPGALVITPVYMCAF